MERFCARLSRAISSKKHPYSSLNRRILELQTLNAVRAAYNLTDILPLYSPMRDPTPKVSFSDPLYPEITLLQPRRVLKLSDSPDLQALRRRISIHLATQWGVRPDEVMPHLPNAVVQYGKVQIADGDTINSLYGGHHGEDQRDATFLQYELLVDTLAHRRGRSNFVPRTYFGQLGRAVVVTISPTDVFPDLDQDLPTNFILLDVEPCDATPDRYGFYEYQRFSARTVIDGTAARAVVGRIKDGGKWVIVKRSGGMEHAEYMDDLQEED